MPARRSSERHAASPEGETNLANGVSPGKAEEMDPSPFRDGTDAVAMKKKFLVVYEVGANNPSGFLPDVPGVVSTAATLEQMRQVMREAVEFHLEALAGDGDPIPEPTTTSVDFAEEDPEHGVLSCIVEWLEVGVPQYHAVA